MINPRWGTVRIVVAILLPIALVLAGLKLAGWFATHTTPTQVNSLTSPAKLRVTHPSPPAQSLPTWTVVEMVSADRFRVIPPHHSQSQVIHLACIQLHNDPTQIRYGSDRLRRLLSEVHNQVQVDVLAIQPDGRIFVELWFASGDRPQLAQVELARAGAATYAANVERCPNHAAIAAAAENTKRRKPPNLLRF